MLGQPPLTFFRQVTASCEYPPLLEKHGVCTKRGRRERKYKKIEEEIKEVLV